MDMIGIHLHKRESQVCMLTEESRSWSARRRLGDHRKSGHTWTAQNRP